MNKHRGLFHLIIGGLSNNHLLYQEGKFRLFFSPTLSLNSNVTAQMLNAEHLNVVHPCFFFCFFFSSLFSAMGRHTERERCWDTWRWHRVCSYLAAGSQTVSARAAPRNTTCCHLSNKSRRWESAHSSARRDAVAHLLKLSPFIYLFINLFYHSSWHLGLKLLWGY